MEEGNLEGSDHKDRIYQNAEPLEDPISARDEKATLVVFFCIQRGNIALSRYPVYERFTTLIERQNRVEVVNVLTSKTG